jgi:hypothetical protein
VWFILFGELTPTTLALAAVLPAPSDLEVLEGFHQMGVERLHVDMVLVEGAVELHVDKYLFPEQQEHQVL